MAYIIFGLQEAMVKSQVKRLIKEFFNSNEESIIRLSGRTNTVQNAVDECNQLSLSSSKKAVVYEGASFLANLRSMRNDQNDYDYLLQYLKDENNDALLIFTLIEKSVNRNNPIVKEITSNGKVFEMKSPTSRDRPLLVRNYFFKRNVKISDDAIEEIVARCNGDLTTFKNEREKLLIYKQNDISLKDVQDIVSKPLETDNFEFLNCLLSGDKPGALKIYRDLVTLGVEPVMLISLLTTSLIFIDEVTYLKNDGLSDDSIAQRLGATIYRVFASERNLKSNGNAKIKKALHELYNLDRAIKRSEVDRFLGFEKFVIDF
jgi:DNA polymerase III delta subunit